MSVKVQHCQWTVTVRRSAGCECRVQCAWCVEPARQGLGREEPSKLGENLEIGDQPDVIIVAAS